MHKIPRSSRFFESLTQVEVRGYQIYGSPWQPEFCDWAFNLPRGEELRQKWSAIPPDTDLLLVHGPPAGHVDMTSRAGRVGCEDLLEAVHQRSISVVVSGHLHSAYGTDADEVRKTSAKASTNVLAWYWAIPLYPIVVFSNAVHIYIYIYIHIYIYSYFYIYIYI